MIPKPRPQASHTTYTDRNCPPTTTQWRLTLTSTMTMNMMKIYSLIDWLSTKWREHHAIMNAVAGGRGQLDACTEYLRYLSFDVKKNPIAESIFSNSHRRDTVFRRLHTHFPPPHCVCFCGRHGDGGNIGARLFYQWGTIVFFDIRV